MVVKRPHRCRFPNPTNVVHVFHLMGQYRQDQQGMELECYNVHVVLD